MKRNNNNKIYGILFVLVVAGVIGFFVWQNGGPGNKTGDEEFAESEDIIREAKGDSDLFTFDNFTLELPAGYKMSDNKTEDLRVVAFEKEGEKGLQISIIPFDEEGPITAERIRTDLPDFVINNGANLQMDKTQAFTFFGQDEYTGDTFEAWFVYDGFLYQVMGYKDSEKVIREMVGSWKWSR